MLPAVVCFIDNLFTYIVVGLLGALVMLFTLCLLKWNENGI